MRLLLDEHYAPRIAELLRGRGHDVAAVAERADLAGLSDRLVFARAVTERRAIATENIKDYVLLIRRAAAAGDVHFGVVLLSRRRLPHTRDGTGALVEALDGLLRLFPREDALRNTVRWLPDT